MQLYKIFQQHPVITTDTRDCPQGSIFFALKGASFNGNDFAQQALDAGCSYAVVDEDVNATSTDRIIRVDDVLTTLQQLAHYHRMQLGTKIIGITGTNGKTTTKELIAAVLSEKYNVLYTQGNFNNHIGVPKTLLRLTSDHDIAVIEMGANHPGEIKTLVDIVEPDCGLITNVGRAHLGGFGSFEGVLHTKGELYDYLRAHNRQAFIDTDNAHLMSIVDGITTIPYVKGEVTGCSPYLSFRWEGGDVSTHLIGDYNVHNMLAAATVGLANGVTHEQINHALSNYIPSNNRSQLMVTAHNQLVVDAYNANPTSMAAALHNFAKMEAANKMVILGSMGELGDVSYDEHKKIIAQLSTMFDDSQSVWLVGSEFARHDHPYRQFANVDEVKAAIQDHQPSDHYILIKGSNSQRLFQLPELL